MIYFVKNLNIAIQQRTNLNIQTAILSSLFTLVVLVFSDQIQNILAKYQVLFILGLPIVAILLIQNFKPHFQAMWENIESEWDFPCSIATGILCTGIQFVFITQCYLKVPIIRWVGVSIFLVVCEIYLIRYFTNRRTSLAVIKVQKREKSEPLFLNDEPVGFDEDELGLKDDAINFAKNVENNNASRSLVFGIDAPWGTGKTSYLEFCKKQWEDDCCLIFEFSPLRYDRDDLIPLFLDSFGDFLLERKYPRGIRILFNKYSRKIAQFPKMFNLDLSGILPDGPSDEDLLNALSDQLKMTDKKIVVIIDDLDRLAVPNIKSFIDTVRVGLKLPNISFVLCFDTKNIFSFEHPLIRNEETSIPSDSTKKITRQFLDNTRFAEYLEKVVMIKQTLIVNPKNVKEYLKKHLFASSGEDGQMFSEKSRSEMLNAIDKFFDPKQFHQYAEQLGDIRKIKRLINVMRLRFGRLSVDISQLDFNGYDLIILMMIYLNFPDLFRKIYLTEIEGKEFFSLEYQHSFGKSNESGYKNSKDYTDFKETLSTTEKLLVDTVFSENRFKDDKNPAVMSGADSAAFNGTLGSGRNLENYLKLIVDSKIPKATAEKKFYVQLVKNLENGEAMEDLSQRPEFTFSDTNNAEFNFSMLMEAMVRNIDVPDLLSKDRLLLILNWLIQNIVRFSEINIENTGIGLRDDLTLHTLYFLDKRGWIDEDGKYYGNSEENVVQAADELLGSASNAGGILGILIAKDRGILGMLDGVKLRLHCSPFRGGDFFNLQRGLQRRAQLSGFLSNDKNFDVMREITQVIFSEFKLRYVDAGISFISDVMSLGEKELYGDSYEFVLKNGLKNDQTIQARKAGIISFLTYQLTNNWKTQLDFGFGLFDESGTQDQGGIQKIMREYLFAVCFNVSNASSTGARVFIDYVLTNYEHVIGHRGLKYKSDINQIGKLLGENELKNYWQTNGFAVKEATKNIIGQFPTGNYTVDYQAELPSLFDALDQYSSDPAAPASVENEANAEE